MWSETSQGKTPGTQGKLKETHFENLVATLYKSKLS